jgi:hypothetical protein
MARSWTQLMETKRLTFFAGDTSKCYKPQKQCTHWSLNKTSFSCDHWLWINPVNQSIYSISKCVDQLCQLHNVQFMGLNPDECSNIYD